MKKTIKNQLSLYSFKLFDKYPEISAFVTTRDRGVSEYEFSSLNLGLHVDDIPQNVINNRQIVAESIGLSPDDLTCGQQTHGTNIRVVSKEDIGRGAKAWDDGFSETDALITNISDVPLMVLTADCAAVFIYDPIAKVIGLVHAGKKGTKERIVSKTILKMSEIFSSNPDDLVVAIGPCIYPCHYDYDLPKEIKTQLLDSGVKAQNIEFSETCTACHQDEFFSYRISRGKTGRFGNIFILNN